MRVISSTHRETLWLPLKARHGEARWQVSKSGEEQQEWLPSHPVCQDIYLSILKEPARDF